LLQINHLQTETGTYNPGYVRLLYTSASSATAQASALDYCNTLLFNNLLSQSGRDLRIGTVYAKNLTNVSGLDAMLARAGGSGPIKTNSDRLANH
jgi:hypothetical protein